MKFLLYLVTVSYICNLTTAVRLALIESNDSVSYMQSLPKETITDVSLEIHGDYGDYYDPGPNSENINETDLEYYVKQLALLGPSTKAYGGPNVKHRFSFTFFTTVTEKLTYRMRKQVHSRAASTYIYKYTQRKTKYPKTTPKPNKRTRSTMRLLQFSTAPVRKKRLLCDCAEIMERDDVCNGFNRDFLRLSTSQSQVRMKRWVGDSPERMDKYTTFESLDRELLYSGRYAPWQIKLYALRKYFDKNLTLPLVTKKKIIGKQKLKKILRRKSIHEPGYREKLRYMSFDQIYNDSNLFPWNATVRQIYPEKKWKHLTQKLPIFQA